MDGMNQIIEWLGIAAIASTIVVAVALFSRSRSDGSWDLPGIDGSWSLTESWASNITIGATALLAVLGASDVVGEFLEESEADAALGPIVVASAFSVALVGLAPLVIKAFTTSDGHIHGLALAVAAAVTLSGVGLQIGVATEQARTVFPDAEVWIVVAALVVSGVLAVYAYRSLRELFGKSTGETEDSEVMKAAKLIAAAINPDAALTTREGASINSSDLLEQALKSAAVPRRRAAIL
jgi:hypothetical protein